MIHAFLLGKITLYTLEVSTNLHFCLKSFKCDTLPSKLSNCGNSTTLTFFSQNAPITYFIYFFIFLKKKKYAGVVSFFFFFWIFLKIKYVIRAFWGKNVKVVELPQFESLGGGGKVSHLKLWRQKCKSVDTLEG
jgi:hypothetical protein